MRGRFTLVHDHGVTQPRTAILHIGSTKTGTSSIQARLEANRDPLAAAGVHLPTSLGRRNHERLIDAANDRAGPEARAFTAEMAALPDTVRRVVFTSEAFGFRLRTPARVAPIRALLAPHFDAFSIHVYLRRQDEHRVSSFSTAMRAGMARRTAPLSGAPPLDYGPLLEAWATVFGQAAVHPRIYARAEFPGGDVVADFVAAARLPVLLAAAGAAAESNTALRPAAQVLLRELARAVRCAGGPADLRTLAGRPWLLAQLDARFAGPGLLPSRAEAAAMLAACRDANERVRARWFPERAALFPEDLSRYPERASAPPDPNEVLEVALTLLATALSGPIGDGGGRVAGAAAAARRAERLRRRGAD